MNKIIGSNVDIYLGGPNHTFALFLTDQPQGSHGVAYHTYLPGMIIGETVLPH